MISVIDMYDVIIIGAGPAGLTAALYTGRNLLKTLVLSKDLGGQTAISGEIQNYPGILETDGLTLSESFKKQTEKLPEVEIKIGEEVAKIEKIGSAFKVKSSNHKVYQAKTIILAAGKHPKKLNVPGEKEFEGRGVSYCATCDAPLFKNKIVAVVGGGYSATEAAYMLAQYAKKIYILTINSKMRGEKITLEKINASKTIEILLNAKTLEILNDDQKVTGLKFKDKSGTKILEVEGVFVEIGYEPNTQNFSELVKLNQWKEVIINSKNETSTKGVFAAGDITNVFAKQTVVAAGEGAKAAMAVNEYLACGK